MGKLCTVLVFAALSAACGDELVQPAAPDVEIAAPSYGKTLDGPGAYVPHYDAEDWWCIIWDSEGEWVPADCVIPQPPSPNGILVFTMHASGIRNLTGKNLKYGPDSYPESLVTAYVDWMGFDPRVDGLMPLCDWNWLLYSPEFRWEDLTCTLNWHYNLSKTGVGTLTAMIGGGKSWHPFPNGR